MAQMPGHDLLYLGCVARVNAREQEPSIEEFVWEDQLGMMSGDVQPLCLASYPGRRHMDRRDAVSLPGPGSVSPKPESRAGIHGVVPIRCIEIPSRRVDGRRSIAAHGSHAIVAAGNLSESTVLLALHRPIETCAGRCAPRAHGNARPCVWPTHETNRLCSGRFPVATRADDRSRLRLDPSPGPVDCVGRCDCGGGAGAVLGRAAHASSLGLQVSCFTTGAEDKLETRII